MDTTILSCQFAFNPLSLLRFIVKNVLLWNPSCSWGPKFADCQRFANSWGRYFTGNWLIALKCRTIHYFVKSLRGVNSWLRVIHEHWAPTNNDDSTVYARIQTNTQAKGPNANSPFWYPYGENCDQNFMWITGDGQRQSPHTCSVRLFHKMFPVQDIEAETVTRTIMDRVIARFGVLSVIHSG